MQRVSTKILKNRDLEICGSTHAECAAADDHHHHHDHSRIRNSSSITLVSDFDTERARREAADEQKEIREREEAKQQQILNQKLLEEKRHIKF